MRVILLLMLLICSNFVYADVGTTIHVPEGAIDTSHCPCNPDINVPDWDAAIQACEACIAAEIQKWQASQSEPAPSLLETEHRQSEEIERLERARKQRRMQEAIGKRQRTDRMRGMMDKLKGEGLTEREFKEMLHLIDELVYDNRYDTKKMNALNQLKSELIGQKAKRDQQKEEVKRQKAYDIAVGNLMEEITEKGIRGEMDKTFPEVLETLKSQGPLTENDRKQLAQIMDHLDGVIDGIIDAGGDDRILGEYYSLMEEFERIYHGGKPEDKVENSYKTSLADEVKRKKAKAAPLTSEEVSRAHDYYGRNKVTRDEIRELRMKAKQAQSSKELQELNVQMNVLHSQQRLQDSIAKDKYRDILEKDPDHIHANYAMSEILRREGKHWESQTARARAMLRASPEVRDELNKKEAERFLRALQVHNPDKESDFIKNMKKDFRAEYLEPVEAEKDVVERSGIISKALEWAWGRAKPLREEVEEVTGIDVGAVNE